jgi:AraC-like DNA-binding protein
LEELVELTPPDARGVMRSGGAGPRSTFLCGGFFFESQPEVRPALLQRLPPVLHAPGGGRSGSALMRVVEMIRDELASGAPGGGVMVDRLMEMLFVQAVRAHLSAHGPARGWLPGIADPKLGKVLARLHRDLAADWTVDRLAGVAGMSRTAFTERFTAVIGVPPLTYVSRCRMDEAMRLLRDQNRTLAEVAEAVGYKSQFAFGKAFKRQLGIGPGAFRRSHVLPPVPEVVGAEERLGA